MIHQALVTTGVDNTIKDVQANSLSAHPIKQAKANLYLGLLQT